MPEIYFGFYEPCAYLLHKYGSLVHLYTFVVINTDTIELRLSETLTFVYRYHLSLSMTSHTRLQ